MPIDHDLITIEGAQELFDWFGYWPDFHDAEVLSLHLNRSGSSTLVIHTWEMTDKIGKRNLYISTKHVFVEFSLRDVSGLNLDGFTTQNVISELSLGRTGGGFRLTLGPCFGLAGTIEATKISIRLMPGEPPDGNL